MFNLASPSLTTLSARGNVTDNATASSSCVCPSATRPQAESGKQLAMQVMRKRVGWDMVPVSIAGLLDIRHIGDSQN